MVLAFTSCQTQLDWDNRPLPADARHLTIAAPTGAIHFTVPTGWHIAHQPALNSPSYSLSRSGTFQPPYLTVTLQTRDASRSSQASLHAEHLAGAQTEFSATRRRPAGAVRAADGRSLAIYEYFGGDGQSWAAFVPERGFVTAFFLSAETAEGIKPNQTSFEELLRSYYVR